GDDRIPLWTIAISAVLLAIVWTFFVAGGAFTTPANFWNKAMNTVEVTLYADTRRQMAAAGTQGLGGSALLGVVFAAGWSPCIGPTLGAAMGIAAQQDISTAVVLITAYSLGLGIPFLITALMLDSAQGILRRLNKHMNKIKIISGIFLVVIGILIASGQLQQLSARFSSQTGSFSFVFDECANGIVEETIDSSELNTCIASGNYSAYVACTDGIDNQKIASDQYDACISSVNSINFVACQHGLSQGVISADQLDACITSNNFNVYVDCSTALAQNNITSDQFDECIRSFSYNRFLDTITPEIETTPEASAPSGVLSANVSSIQDTARQLPDVGLAVGQIAPNFSATTITGDAISLNDLRGKTVLLNFWFTTCAPCKKEMPAFQNAYDTHSESFVVVAINREESAEAVSDFGTELALTFPLVLDPRGDLQAQFNVIGYPTTYLIDPNGMIIAYHAGPLSDADIAELISTATS
ncbi:MAG: redoxin domain-containing protein, partial [Anaerolineae bacterium]|nr:redoxin domain-containing protein [Anaerolineae bacterium]